MDQVSPIVLEYVIHPKKKSLNFDRPHPAAADPAIQLSAS